MSIYPDKKDGKLTGRFRVEVQFNGKRARGRFNDYASAKKANDEWMAQFAAGAIPIAVKERVDARGKPRTLEQLIDKASGSLWRGKKTEENSFARLRLAFRRLGLSSSIDSIQTVDIDKMVMSLSEDGSSDATINRYLSAVCTALKWAKDRGYRTTELPTFPWTDEDNGRIRWITEPEEDALLSYLPNRIGRLVRVAIETGLRRGELLSLEPRDVEPDWVRLWKTKTNSPRSVPLTKQAYSDLQTLLEGMPHVHELRYHWDRARVSMGLSDDPDFVFHACRHTCATRLVRRNVNLRIVQRWMGHKRIETTMRYAHVNDEMLLAARQPHQDIGQMIEVDPLPHGEVVAPLSSLNSKLEARGRGEIGRHAGFRFPSATASDARYSRSVGKADATDWGETPPQDTKNSAD